MIQGQEPGPFRQSALQLGLGEKKKKRRRKVDETRIMSLVYNHALGRVQPSFGTEEGLTSNDECG